MLILWNEPEFNGWLDYFQSSSWCLGLDSTIQDCTSLGLAIPGCRRRAEFSLPLLTLLQFQNYLVSCISAHIFIIPKLRNICWIKIFSELFSLQICYDLLNYVILLAHLSPPFSINLTGVLVLFQLK